MCRERARSRAEGLVLLLLALRVLAWAFLLPAWGGADEPFHHGYVESCIERPAWHPFGSLGLPARLIGAIRRWPAAAGYASEFQARNYGEAAAPAPRPVLERNYETLQSPAYYVGAGILLKALPRIPPIGELYLLRAFNALLAWGIGLGTLSAARELGFGERAWWPVAILAFVPGFSGALCRVSNDALCAVLISAAICGVLRRENRAWDVFGAAAAGFAPWAKLYGWCAVPGSLWARRRDSKARLAAGVALLLVPGGVLALLSRIRNGHAISLLEILNRPTPANFGQIPWLRDLWTIGKTHIWVSGISAIVFPTPVYAVLVAALAGLLAATLGAFRGADESARRALGALAIPVVCFGLALAFFSWKNFELYRAPGGTGGWYLWAMALPESLLLAWGACRSRSGRKWLLAVLAAFFAVGVCGDLALFAEVSGRLRVSPGNHHLLGLAPASPKELLAAFLASRPLPAAVAAAALASASWLLGAWILATRAVERAPTPPAGG